MAKIKEELLIIKVSTIVKDNEDGDDILSEDICGTLEEVVAGLVNNEAAVVEVDKAS